MSAAVLDGRDMTHPECAAAAFVREFVRDVPESEPVLEEHLIDNFDELLPYVVMADLTRWIISLQRVAEGGDDAAAELRDRALDFVERHYSTPGNSEVRNLIGASFVENLHQAGTHQRALVQRLGPGLRSALSGLDGQPHGDAGRTSV